MLYKWCVLIVMNFFLTSLEAEPLTLQTPETISPTVLQNFNLNSKPVKKIIELVLQLAGQNLGYHYGAAEPKMGGMDCSGTVYYVLKTMGLKEPPRSSESLYKWVWEEGQFYAVNSLHFNSFEFSRLKPGDLLFWSGTYQANRDPNVTHVMFYLGVNNKGEPLMAGASNGRSYKGRKIYGVSVFDFQLPAANSNSHFLGYSCIPTLSC